MIDKSFVETVIEKSRPATFEADGNTFVHPDYAVKKTSVPESIKTETLAGFVEILCANIDKWDKKKLLVHVESPGCVTLRPALDSFARRPVLVEAGNNIKAFGFDRYHLLEDFRIALLSLFQISGDTTLNEHDEYVSDDRYLLEISSGITRDASKNIEDDGTRQHVTLKNGFAFHGQKAAIRNIVRLRPFRTFREIEEQPSSPFVFRITEKDSGIMLGLWEADGNAWRLEAMQKIKVFLEDKLSGFDIPIVA